MPAGAFSAGDNVLTAIEYIPASLTITGDTPTTTSTPGNRQRRLITDAVNPLYPRSHTRLPRRRWTLRL